MGTVLDLKRPVYAKPIEKQPALSNSSAHVTKNEIDGLKVNDCSTALSIAMNSCPFSLNLDWLASAMSGQWRNLLKPYTNLGGLGIL